MKVFNLNSESKAPTMEIDMRDKVKSLFCTFDNTGLILVIGCTYLKEEIEYSKLEMHSISEGGSKGKFQNLFLQETGRINNIVFQ